MIDHDLNCASHGPDGAMCQKIRGHKGNHGGVDARGSCRCCLAAEVEALRARNETLIATIQRQDSTFERQMEEHEELEALRAQVQRVREACEPFGPMGSIAVWRILRALDGDA